MKKLIVCLLVCLLAVPCCASASPDVESFRCLVVPVIATGGILPDPFDRWAAELVAMVEPELQYTQWRTGQALILDVWLSDTFCFSVELMSEGSRAFMQSTLSEDGWVELDEAAAAEARAFMENILLVYAPETDWQNADCTLSLSYERAAEQLRYCRDVVSRWQEFAGEDKLVNDSAIGISAAMDEIAKILDESSAGMAGTPFIDAQITYSAPNLVASMPSDALEPDPSRPAKALSKLPDAVLKTVNSLS